MIVVWALLLWWSSPQTLATLYFIEAAHVVPITAPAKPTRAQLAERAHRVLLRSVPPKIILGVRR